MKLDKQDVQRALKTISAPGEGENMIDSGAVKNIIVNKCFKQFHGDC